jgi:hypothetical protein
MVSVAMSAARAGARGRGSLLALRVSDQSAPQGPGMKLGTPARLASQALP